MKEYPSVLDPVLWTPENFQLWASRGSTHHNRCGDNPIDTDTERTCIQRELLPNTLCSISSLALQRIGYLVASNPIAAERLQHQPHTPSPPIPALMKNIPNELCLLQSSARFRHEIAQKFANGHCQPGRYIELGSDPAIPVFWRLWRQIFDGVDDCLIAILNCLLLGIQIRRRGETFERNRLDYFIRGKDCWHDWGTFKSELGDESGIKIEYSTW